MIHPSRLLLAAAALLAPPAQAGETACWFERGLVVAPASVLGVAGDYIVDTGQAATELHETRAQAAGFEGASLAGEVRLAGVRLSGQPVRVADLDPRAGALPTPIAGVIGLDVLRGYVVDLRLAPCRLRLSPPGAARRFGHAVRLPLVWIAGRPGITAGVSDGPHAWRGPFVVATGADAPVRISDGAATVPGAAKPPELYAYGAARPRLRALSLAGGLLEDVPAGLEKDQGAAGTLGAAALAAWRLRFDFPRGVLLLAPAAP